MDDKIRVVHCCFSTGDGGGIPRMEALAWRYLDRSRFDPVFVVTGPENQTEIAFEPEMPYSYTGENDKFEALLEFFTHADIVQFSGGFDPLVCEAARVAEVPVLVEVMHLMEPGQLYENIDMSVCVSEGVRRVLTHPDHRTTVILNGIDCDLYPFPEKEGERTRVVLLESTRREKAMHQHLDELADDLFAMDTRVELWLAGRGQEGVSSERLRFLGLRSDVATLYRQAAMMTLLSVKEPFGLVVIEAMASGCLPFVANDGGMAEIIDHGRDGWLVDGSDTEEIHSVMREALSLYGTARWEDMRRAGRKKVEECFSGRGCIGQYEKIYTELIERKGRRITPGRVDITATPDALVAELIPVVRSDNGDEAQRLALKISASADRVSPPLFGVIIRLADRLVTIGREETAALLYGAAFRSGAREAGWMARWVCIAPDGADIDAVVDELLVLAPEEMTARMLQVERLLKQNDPQGAMQSIEAGLAAAPGSPELQEVVALIKGRLGA